MTFHRIATFLLIASTIILGARANGESKLRGRELASATSDLPNDRGLVVYKSAWIQNVKTQGCLYPSKNNGTSDTRTNKCLDIDEHRWTMYENGEIVNDASGYCLAIISESGKVEMQPCRQNTDVSDHQIFELDEFITFGTLQSLKDPEYCLESNVQVNECNGQEGQQWLVRECSHDDVLSPSLALIT